MSMYQYATGAHYCPNAKHPIAIDPPEDYHCVVKVGWNPTKGHYGYIRPGVFSTLKPIGDLCEEHQDLAGHQINIFGYAAKSGNFYLYLEGGNPDGWTSVNVTLPSGANFSMPWSDLDGAFVWPFDDKEFSNAGVSITVHLTPVT